MASAMHMALTKFTTDLSPYLLSDKLRHILNFIWTQKGFRVLSLMLHENYLIETLDYWL